MAVIKHRHFSAAILRSQLAYAASAQSLATAKNITARKLRNCRLLLTNYRASRQRANSNQGILLNAIQNQLLQAEKHIDFIEDRSVLFQLEARAARRYWQAIRLLCNQKPDWKRVYPHARDPLNILFNVGYTFLANQCLTAIMSAGLMPEIGIMYGDNSGNALVYDFMECFRQPAVDALVIPIFSRKKISDRESTEKENKINAAKIINNRSNRFLYQNRCERWENIFKNEAVKLRRDILTKKSWLPYQHSWRHENKCQ